MRWFGRRHGGMETRRISVSVNYAYRVIHAPTIPTSKSYRSPGPKTGDFETCMEHGRVTQETKSSQYRNGWFTKLKTPSHTLVRSKAFGAAVPFNQIGRQTK